MFPAIHAIHVILLSQDYENKRNLKHIRFTLIFPVRYKKSWQVQQLLVKGLYDLDMEMETLEVSTSLNFLPHLSFILHKKSRVKILTSRISAGSGGF